MSRASLMVRFPDGKIRHGLYDGTSDMAYRPLYASGDEAWIVYHTDRNKAFGTSEQWAGFAGIKGLEVEIFTDYGGGFWWQGQAIWSWVTSGTQPWDDELETFDGRPEWVDAYYKAAIKGEQE